MVLISLTHQANPLLKVLTEFGVTRFSYERFIKEAVFWPTNNSTGLSLPFAAPGQAAYQRRY